MSASRQKRHQRCSARLPQHLAREQAADVRTRCAGLQLGCAGRPHRLKRSRGPDGDRPRIVEMRREAGGRVARALPTPQRVGRHRPDRRIVALQSFDGDACGLVVEPHVRQRFKCRRAYLDAGVASPAAQDGPRPGRATDGQGVDVVEAVCRIDLRQLQQKRLAVGSERLERRATPAAVQGGVVHPHDDGLQRRRIVHVRQPVERGGPHVRVRIVERGDELRRCGPWLERARARAARARAATTTGSAGNGRRAGTPTSPPRSRESLAIRSGSRSSMSGSISSQREREPMSRGSWPGVRLAPFRLPRAHAARAADTAA